MPGAKITVVPGGRAASTMHVVPYETLPLAYDAVLAWMHERGLRPHGTARETFLTTPDEADPEDLITEVIIPVSPESP